MRTSAWQMVAGRCRARLREICPLLAETGGLAFALVAATVHSEFKSGSQHEAEIFRLSDTRASVERSGRFYPFLWNSDNYLHFIISAKSLQPSEGLAVLEDGIRRFSDMLAYRVIGPHLWHGRPPPCTAEIGI